MRKTWFLMLALFWLAALPLLAQSWIPIPASGISDATANRDAHAAYDPTSNRLISFHGQCCLHQTDVWVETNANGVGGTAQWVNLIPNGAPGSPPGRHNNSAVYDPVNNRLIIYGGCGGGCFPILNDVWVLINANGVGGTPSWQQLFPSGQAPLARQGHSAIYDPATNTVTIFGGQNGSCCPSGILTDTWVLTNANGLGGTPAWKPVAGSNPAVGAYFATAVYDGASATMTVFGGVLFGSGTLSNAVWTLSNANGQGGPAAWTQLIPNGDPNSPPARSSHSAVYDPNGNQMTIFGGADSFGSTTSDVWTLSNANGLDITPPSWTQLAPNGGPPAIRAGHSGAFDPGTGRIIIFGGAGFDGSYSSTWDLQF